MDGCLFVLPSFFLIVMDVFLLSYPHVVKRIIFWAKSVSERVQKTGVALPKKHFSMALQLGVQDPSAIRVMVVPEGKIVEDEKILQLLKKFDLDIYRLGALTLYRSILFSPQTINKKWIVAHELRHVAQQETCGSLEVFMTYYLLEIAHFGYGKGPFEIDATEHAKKFIDSETPPKKPKQRKKLNNVKS